MKTRVLFLHTATRPPLGADTWIHTLIMRYLDRSRHEIHVACAQGSSSEPTPTFEAVRAIPDLRIFPVNLGTELFAKSPTERLRAMVDTAPALWNVTSLARYVQKHRIQVLHTSDRPRDALVSVALGRLTGAKSIVHVHVAYGAWMSRMLKWSMAHCNALIGVSDFVTRSLIEGGGFSAQKTHTALNAIDLQKWNADTDGSTARAEFGVGPDEVLLICVARIFPAKGQDRLIRALSLLRPEFPRLKALIVGQDYPTTMHYTDELKVLAEQLGVAGNLIFTGLRKDIPRLFAAADVLVMPSIEEPFGLVYVESMAMRRPVIAFDDGGTPEVVDQGKSGLLSATGDVAALAANIATLVRDTERRREMGEYGRKQAETRFNPQRLASDIEGIYSKLLS